MKLIHSFILGYVKKVLASWVGFAPLGYVGIAKEANWGTPVTPTDYFEIMSESLGDTIDRFPTRNIIGGIYEPDDYAGLRRVAGDIAMFGHPVSIGTLLKAAMNTVSGSVVLSGFLFNNRFTTTKSEWSDGAGLTLPSQSYTIEVHRDVTSAFQYAGAVLNRLQMALAPNQDLRVTANWIAKAALLRTAGTPTFPGSSTDPFTFDSASLSIAGAATAKFESLQLSINNGLQGIPTLNASNTVAKIRRTALPEVRMSGVIGFEDVSEYLDFKNQTERAFAFNLFRSASFNMLVEMPRFVYTALQHPMGGRDRLVLNFEGMARYHTGSANAFSALLTTTKSNY